jgi:bifunctional non-homologous end joining protein LigD
VKRGREVALFSGNQKVLNERFPKVVDALASLKGDFVLDGELVAIDSQGRPSFQLLQKNPVSGASSLFLRLRSAKPKMGSRWLTCRLNAAASCWGECFPSPKTRCAYNHCCGLLLDKFLRRYASSVFEGVVGKRIGSLYEPGERSGALDQAPQESRAGFRHRRFLFPVPIGLMHCS